MRVWLVMYTGEIETPQGMSAARRSGLLRCCTITRSCNYEEGFRKLARACDRLPVIEALLGPFHITGQGFSEFPYDTPNLGPRLRYVR